MLTKPVVQEYHCKCHVGLCPLHEVDNPARFEFMGLCEKVYKVTEADDYYSVNRCKARALLHAADYYVEQILQEYIKEK